MTRRVLQSKHTVDCYRWTGRQYFEVYLLLQTGVIITPHHQVGPANGSNHYTLSIEALIAV